jgi:Cof subfamily protein (haloacid dehalogenase superfamily)
MSPKLLAFDLDGTLLTTDKRLTAANRDALSDMVAGGAVVALASGRLRASMQTVARQLDIDPAMLTLNGAAVYLSASPEAQAIHRMGLQSAYAEELLTHAASRDFALNFYTNDTLHTVRSPRTARWTNLYVDQTSSVYEFVDSLDDLRGTGPEKIIFVGDAATLDEEERYFRTLWGDQVYIVRTWDYYLEFLHRDANKGTGLAALAGAFGVDLADAAAFGDSNNDTPMLEVVGHPVAMANSTAAAREAAGYVSPWSNDDDGVAREWERMKRLKI